LFFVVLRTSDTSSDVAYSFTKVAFFPQTAHILPKFRTQLVERDFGQNRLPRRRETAVARLLQSFEQPLGLLLRSTAPHGTRPAAGQFGGDPLSAQVGRRYMRKGLQQLVNQLVDRIRRHIGRRPLHVYRPVAHAFDVESDGGELGGILAEQRVFVVR